MIRVNTKPMSFRREYYPKDFNQAQKNIELSVILPTFNEEQNIQILIPRLTQVLENANIEFEILVVDDNSPDKTYHKVRDFAKNDSRIRLIRRIEERGLSSAVVTGMASAAGHYYIVMDADMQHDESILPVMLEHLKKNDIVVGSRLVGEGSYGSMSKIRHLMSKMATVAARLILRISVKDPMSGFFGIRKEYFDKISNQLDPKGFKILLEILARSKDATMTEVGYEFRNRNYGTTKLTGSVIFQYLIALIEIRFGYKIPVTFFKYAIVGSLGVVVNLFGQFLSTFLFGLEYKRDTLLRPSFAVAIGFELSVLFNYFANNFWTFKEVSRSGFVSHFIGGFKFQIVSIYGFVIQIAVWHLLLQLMPETFLVEAQSYIANLGGILFATVNNYYLNKNFTWVTARGLVKSNAV